MEQIFARSSSPWSSPQIGFLCPGSLAWYPWRVQRLAVRRFLLIRLGLSMNPIFKDNFTKYAFLKDLWKGKEHLFERAKDLALQTRFRNTPDVELRTSKDLGQSIVGELKRKFVNPKLPHTPLDRDVAALRAAPLATLAPSMPGNKTTIVDYSALVRTLAPKRSAQARFVGTPDAHRMGLHHELDEAAQVGQSELVRSKMMSDALHGRTTVAPHEKATVGNTFSYAPRETKESYLNMSAAHGRLRDAVKNKGGLSVKERLRQGFSAAADFSRQVSADLANRRKHTQAAGHMSPSIIVDESNRLFNEANQKTVADFQDIRHNISGEAKLLGKRGLRYGEEYVQPGTRRYNKLITNVMSDVDKAGHNSVELFKDKKRP